MMQPGCSSVMANGPGSCPRSLQAASLPHCCSHAGMNAGSACGFQLMRPSTRWVERWGDQMMAQALRERAGAAMRQPHEWVKWASWHLHVGQGTHSLEVHNPDAASGSAGIIGAYPPGCMNQAGIRYGRWYIHAWALGMTWYSKWGWA